MNSPGFQRVTLIPMETTLFSSENSHTEKQPFWEKGLMLEIKLGPLLSGPSVSKILWVESQGPQVMILDHFYTIHQMYGPQIFVFQKIVMTYTLL